VEIEWVWTGKQFLQSGQFVGVIGVFIPAAIPTIQFRIPNKLTNPLILLRIINMAEGVGFVPENAIFYVNLAQFPSKRGLHARTQLLLKPTSYWQFYWQ
jgi:hypothetical protein